MRVPWKIVTMYGPGEIVRGQKQCQDLISKCICAHTHTQNSKTYIHNYFFFTYLCDDKVLIVFKLENSLFIDYVCWACLQHTQEIWPFWTKSTV